MKSQDYPKTFIAGKNRIPYYVLLAIGFCFPGIAFANDEYYRHTYFDNSLTRDFYFYSTGRATGHSFVEQKNGKLPVETKIFFTPPNALRLEWQSEEGGGWEAEVQVVNFRNRFPEFRGNTLSLWCFATQAVAGSDLPLLTLSSTREGLQVAQFPESFSEAVPLGTFSGDIPAGRWVQIHIPLAEFHSASIYDFQPRYVQNIIFHQNRPDGIRHTLILDEICIDDLETGVAGQTASNPLAPPKSVRAKGYDRHIEVQWDPANDLGVVRYIVYRSMNGGPFEPIGIQPPDKLRYTDFLGKAGLRADYKVAASGRDYRQSALSEVAGAATREFDDNELLTMLQEAWRMPRI